MVVIVPYPVFVKRRRTGGLDTPQQPLFHECSKNIVNCLTRYDSDLRSHKLSDLVRSAVRAGLDSPEDGQSLSSDRDAMAAKQTFETIHGTLVYVILWTESITLHNHDAPQSATVWTCLDFVDTYFPPVTMKIHFVLGFLSLSAAFPSDLMGSDGSNGNLATRGETSTQGKEAMAWRQFLADTAKGNSSRIPDFSYSGHRHGECTVPEITGPVFKVTDYGAHPDASASSAPAMQLAIDACEAAGGGGVLFPKGVFLINDDERATAPTLRISKSRVIPRGEGSSADGTVLYSPATIQP
jgi:hypothetical protein